MQSIKPAIVLKQSQSSRGVLEKKCSWRFRIIHRKAPVLEFQAWNFNKKDNLAQVFFCEYYGIFMEWSELLFYGVAASGKVRCKSRNPQNFSFSYFWLHLISRAPSTSWQDNCKIQSPQKMMCGDKSIHIAIQTSKHLNIMKIQFPVICSQL